MRVKSMELIELAGLWKLPYHQLSLKPIANFTFLGRLFRCICPAIDKIVPIHLLYPKFWSPHTWKAKYEFNIQAIINQQMIEQRIN